MDTITEHAYYQSTREDACSTCDQAAGRHERIGTCAYPTTGGCPRGDACLLIHDGYEKPARKRRKKPADTVIISRPLAEALDALCSDLERLGKTGHVPYGLTASWPNVKALLPEGGLAGGEGP